MSKQKLSEETKRIRKEARAAERKRKKFHIKLNEEKLELLTTINTFDGPVRLWKSKDTSNDGSVIIDTEGYLCIQSFTDGENPEPAENTIIQFSEEIFIGIARAYKHHPEVVKE